MPHATAPPPNPSIKEFIDRTATQSCLKQCDGIAIGVVFDDKQLVTCAGVLDSKSKEPITENTIFEIGSLTKLFTSALLADCVTRQEIRLDDPVQSALPDKVRLPSDGQSEITWRSLANHRSSLPRLPDDLLSTADYENPYVHYDQEKLYGCLNRMELLSPIGANCEYSNLGVGLLGHAIGKRIGSDYHQALKQRILLPLGMSDTYSKSDQPPRDSLATSHTRKNVATKHWDFTETTVAAGGLRSSLADMMQFLVANVHLNDSKLSDSFAKMREPSELPIAKNVKRSIWTAPFLQAYVMIAVMLSAFATILLLLQWRSEFSAIGFLFAPFLLTIFVVTLHFGTLAGIAATIAFALLLPGYFFAGFGGIPELIWSAVCVYLGQVWKSSIDCRGSGEGRLAWQAYPMGDYELLWHNGMVGGAASYLGVVPELKVGVVVLTNTATSVDGIGDKIVKELIRISQ